MARMIERRQLIARVAALLALPLLAACESGGLFGQRGAESGEDDQDGDGGASGGMGGSSGGGY